MSYLLLYHVWAFVICRKRKVLNSEYHNGLRIFFAEQVKILCFSILYLNIKSIREVADQEFEAAKASFPSEEVSGEDEKLGMGTADKEFDTIKSFTWTFGGTGSVGDFYADLFLWPDAGPGLENDLADGTDRESGGCRARCSPGCASSAGRSGSASR